MYHSSMTSIYLQHEMPILHHVFMNVRVVTAWVSESIVIIYFVVVKIQLKVN